MQNNNNIKRLEELLSIAQGEPLKDDKPNKGMYKGLSDTKEAVKFVRQFQITRGSTPVPTLVFYTAYCEWRTRPINRHKFTYELKNIFPIYKKGRYRYVDVDNFPFDLVKHISKRKQEKASRKAYRIRQNVKGKKKTKKEEESTSTQSNG